MDNRPAGGDCRRRVYERSIQVRRNRVTGFMLFVLYAATKCLVQDQGEGAWSAQVTRSVSAAAVAWSKAATTLSTLFWPARAIWCVSRAERTLPWLSISLAAISTTTSGAPLALS